MKHLWHKWAGLSDISGTPARVSVTLRKDFFPAPVAGLSKRIAIAISSWRPRNIAAATSDALFVALIVFNVVRTLRHAMWRDELHAFMVALASSSPWALLLRLKYEGHPGLWYMLLWALTRVTSDPLWMQVLHIALATGVWLIIYRCSPFHRYEKFLLLLSYFLFWEYFVISRSYVLIALIAFIFIALREGRQRPEFVLWLLLGLLANVHVLGAIWSMVLAGMLALEEARGRSVPIAGPVVYLILLVFAIATMLPAADFSPWGHEIQFSVARLNTGLNFVFGALMPLKPESIRDLVAFLANPATTSFPQFWNANPTAEFVALSGADTEHPIRLALALALPIAGCWLIVRNPLLLLEFALVYLGIELFANIWNFPGRARHHGAVFLALIAAAWSARARHSPTTSSSWTLAALLVVNAFAGVLTVASELRPFSEGYNAAAWIKQNNLADAFLIGSRDAQVQTVAGYLGRSIYYLECDCLGTFVVWNEEREDALSADEFWRRLHKAASLAGQREAILIRHQPIAPDDLKAAAPSLSLTLLHSFANAAMYPGWTEGAENFWIYRVSVEKPR